MGYDVDDNNNNNYNHLPLHVKPVGRINYAALEGLPVLDPATHQNWLRAKRYLVDVHVYDRVPRRQPHQIQPSRMSHEHVQKMVDFNVLKPIAPEDVRAGMRLFTVREKIGTPDERLRPIRWTRDINDVVTKEELVQLRYPTKVEICEFVHSGEYAVAFDMAAFFDQFEVHPDIAALQCTRVGNQYFAATTNPMGARSACACAQTCMDILRSFQTSCRSASIVDGVIFIASSRDEVVAAGREFVARCRAIGATLNETKPVEELVAQQLDWGGVSLDFVAKTTRLMGKTLRKIEYSWGERRAWSWRRFFGHIGLLFWAVGILDFDMSQNFNVLRFISAASRRLQERPDEWDSPALVWPSVMRELDRWTREALANAPRAALNSNRRDYDWIVATDASSWGYGYTAWSPCSGEVRVFGEPWSASMRHAHGSKLGRSTFSEPTAVVNAMCRLLPGAFAGRVLVLTDNTVTRYSFARGWNAHSYDINECLRRLRAAFPSARFAFEYIQGEINPADAASRGRQEDVQRDIVEQVLRRWHSAQQSGLSSGATT